MCSRRSLRTLPASGMRESATLGPVEFRPRGRPDHDCQEIFPAQAADCGLGRSCRRMCQRYPHPRRLHVLLQVRQCSGMRWSGGTGYKRSPPHPCRLWRAAPAPAEPTVVVAGLGAPPNKPGECYTKVFLPAEFRDEPTQQLVRPAGERSEYTEPVYEEVEEHVVVKPAWKRTHGRAGGVRTSRREGARA